MDSPTQAIRRTFGVHCTNYIALLLLSFLFVQTHLEDGVSVVFAQQSYYSNNQFDCYVNHTNTEGYTCNGPSSCTSYLTFRSSPPYYSSVPSISFLLSADPSAIAAANHVTDVAIFPSGHVVLVPVNCSCAAVYTAIGVDGKRRRHDYYQHNATYTLKTKSETYLTVANNTYGGLTTCQAMMAQNPVDSYHLTLGLKLVAPLMCACPSTNQTAKGFKYIVSYLAGWNDDVSFIAELFGAPEQDVLDANELSSDSTIFPFNPILVPMKSRPTNLNLNRATPSPAPSPPSPPPPPQSTGEGGSSKSWSRWAFFGAGIGASLLIIAISLFVFCFFFRRRQSKKPSPRSGRIGVGEEAAAGGKLGDEETADYRALAGVGSAAKDDMTTSNSWSVSSNGVLYAVESLTVYKFQELQRATGNFSESSRIKGSVFRGYFNGDPAAVKIMKADVSGEINILKQINHSNIIRLSGFCVHDGNTYFVYEYAEKGSLQDWLLGEQNKNGLSVLGWKQRVQIAYDIADGLNYLHNYTNPPYIHRNLTSGNVMLDANLRAKITNFGLARSIGGKGNASNEYALQNLTRHVVGTHGYLAPEFIEIGLITPKLDVFAFGIILAELLSGKVVSTTSAPKTKGKDGGERAEQDEGLTASLIRQLFVCENPREGLRSFVDGAMGYEYPLDLAYSMAQLAKSCVETDPSSRPSIAEVLMALLKIHSSSLDWDPLDNLGSTSSINYGR